MNFRKKSPSNIQKMLIGVISDTHGLMRPQISRAFEQVDMIFHAGDIGNPGIIQELENIAPVAAVRGNMDSGRWAEGFNKTEFVETEGFHFYIIHDLYGIDISPEAAGIQAVISGHTHKSEIYIKNDVLYLNPGSAGPIRHGRPPSVGLISISENSPQAEIIELI